MIKQVQNWRVAVIGYFFATLCISVNALPPINLFQPYDVLIKPQRPPLHTWQLMVGYEGAFHIRGFMEDEDFSGQHIVCAKGNVLQLWQKKQDAIAAFKGQPATSAAGAQSQFFNINDDNHTHGIFCPCASLHIPVNMLFGLQYRLPWNLTLAAYLPYRVAKLDDVVWREQANGVTFEQLTGPDLITKMETVGNMSLRGWKRHGVGDLALQLEYYRHFPQAKPYLRNVGLEIRGGFLVPTGLKTDPDKLLAFPFGYDAGLGIMIAGRLELWYIHHLRIGIDVELLHLFGSTRQRRIATDPAQTDLFLLSKSSTFKDPGFVQHYTIYGDLFQAWRGLSARLAYQYTKHNEDRYYPCAQGVSFTTVNNAESLQEGTTHSIIAALTYDWNRPVNACWKPSISLLYKNGFNGKRALLVDSVSCVLSVAF